MKNNEETLNNALKLLVGEVMRVQWLDSGADHVVETMDEIANAELCTQTTIGALAKVDDTTILLIHNAIGGMKDNIEGIQIAQNCIEDVDIYSKDTGNEEE